MNGMTRLDTIRRSYRQDKLISHPFNLKGVFTTTTDSIRRPGTRVLVRIAGRTRQHTQAIRYDFLKPRLAEQDCRNAHDMRA